MREVGLGVLVLVLVAWLGGYVLGLGAVDIDSSLEGFRAVVARETLDRGDWIVPHVGGSVYLSKPPLLPWAIALASLPGGQVTEVTARLPSVCSVLATALLLLVWARRRGDALAGAAAALLFLPWLGFPRAREPWSEGRAREVLAFLGWAVVVPLVAFSLIRGKEDRYLLPLYPALALLGGYGASRAVEGFRQGRAGDPARVLASVGALALVAAGAALAWALVARTDRPAGEAALLGAALVALGTLAFVAVGRRSLRLFVASLALAFLPLGAARARVWAPLQNAKRSPRPMCEALNERVPPGAPLVLLGPPRPQVVFYLRGPVRLRARVEDAIRESPDTSAWFVWGPWAQSAEQARFERPPGVAVAQEERFL